MKNLKTEYKTGEKVTTKAKRISKGWGKPPEIVHAQKGTIVGMENSESRFDWKWLVKTEDGKIIKVLPSEIEKSA